MPRIDDYKAAIALAVAALSTRNPKFLAARSRAEYTLEGDREVLLLPYFGQVRRVVWPEVAVTDPASPRDLPLTEQILILHYLDRTDGEAPSGQTIDFRSVPDGGGFYWTAFVSRAKKPLVETFGGNLDFYLKVAQAAGGEPQPLGDVAVRFLAFPLVPITHVFWRGDDEFPPDANILFDATISRHLSTEDIAALAGASVYRLMAAARELKQRK
jgi:hypothetical protein